MGVINYIEFGDVKSSDYGIYVSGEGVFKSAERAVDFIEIPGRNGEYAFDKGTFKNIKVSYRVFNQEEDLEDFRTKLSDFRNALLSKTGYQRLEDTFHPDEYRMAVYAGPMDIEPILYNTASEFELTFDCKPQRFLKSGEVKQALGGEWGETQTVSGSIATFEAEAGTGIKSLVVDIEPVQSGTGDPSPTNVRPISGWNSVVISHSGEDTTDPQTITKTLGRTVYGGTLDLISGELTITKQIFNVDFRGRTGTGQSGKYGWYSAVVPNIIKPAFNEYPTGMLCNRLAVGTRNESYNGLKDCVSIHQSEGRIYTYVESLSAMTLAQAQAWLENNPIQVVYPLLTPEVIQLTEEQIETILGTNNIWADSGEVSVEYGVAPNVLVNPTLFESHPLLEVRGYGAINMGDESVVIHNEPVGRVNLAVTQTVLENTANTFEFSVAVNDPTVYQTGDEITFLHVTVQMKLNGSVYRAKISDKSNMGARANGRGGGTMLYLDIPTLIAESGVDGATYTGWADVTIKTSHSASPYTVRYSLSVLWDDDTNTMTYTLTLPDPSPLTYIPAQTNVGQSTARADSTKPSLGDPLYIDLDIGEAYKIEGTVIPINSAVEIPAELPTLKAGANLITYDDTITQLDITPRWWKI